MWLCPKEESKPNMTKVTLHSPSNELLFLTKGQKMGIRVWTRMIRTADEERAVRFLTGLVLNLAGDQLVLDAALEATKNQPMN